jgi:hypothetical protein
MIEAFTRALSDAATDPERVAELADLALTLSLVAGETRRAILARNAGDLVVAKRHEARLELHWASAREKSRAA